MSARAYGVVNVPAQGRFRQVVLALVWILGGPPLIARATAIEWQLVHGNAGMTALAVRNNTGYAYTTAFLCPAPSGKTVQPIIIEVPAHGFVMRPADVDRKAQQTMCRAAAQPGLMSASATSAPMRLPFSVARGVCVGQAWPAQRTHVGREKFAIDFLTNIGEPVVAARDGIVLEAEGRFTKGGKDPALLSQANYVKILHDDGTLAMYAHLHTNSVLVNIGQRVKAGQQIAQSGFTGYAEGPHLHFAVGRPAIDVDASQGSVRVVYDTLPVEFQLGAATPGSVMPGSLLVASSGAVHHERFSDACRDPAAKRGP